MKYATAEQVLADQFTTHWPLQSLATPVIFENQGFDPNDSILTAPYPAGGPWVLVEIVWADERQISFGGTNGNYFAADGRLQVHCFVPEDTGRGLATALFDQVCALFRGQILPIGSSGQIRSCGIKPISAGMQNQKDGPFWGMSAFIDIIYEDLA